LQTKLEDEILDMMEDINIPSVAKIN